MAVEEDDGRSSPEVGEMKEMITMMLVVLVCMVEVARRRFPTKGGWMLLGCGDGKWIRIGVVVVGERRRSET